MTTLSPAAERIVIDALARACKQLSLHTGPPGRVGAHELSGEYARRYPCTWDAAGWNQGVIDCIVPPGTTITHIGLWDGSRFMGPITSDPVSLPDGGIYRIQPHVLSLAVKADDDG